MAKSKPTDIPPHRRRVSARVEGGSSITPPADPLPVPKASSKSKPPVAVNPDTTPAEED